MGFFKKEKEATEEDLLNKIEEETMDLGKLPPKPAIAKAAPVMPKPIVAVPKPAPSPVVKTMPVAAPTIMAPAEIPEMPKPTLSTAQVAKMPLFLKVQQYDEVIQELNGLVGSFTTMEEIMERMSKIEAEETIETKRWKSQLELTRGQIRKLLSELPETGRIREVLDAKKKGKGKKSKKLDAEIDELKKTIAAAKKKAPAAKKKPEPSEAEKKLQSEVDALHGGIKDLHDEMKHLHLELKMLNSLSQLKSQKMVKDIKKTAAASYTKTKETGPWE